ncbi:MAG: helix-hairpin-helix domain-containing protein [Acidimicrobiales bacterium]
MPDAPLPPLPPAGQPQWLTWLEDLRRRIPPRRLPLVAGGVVGLLLVVAVLLRPTGQGHAAALPTTFAAPVQPAEPAQPRSGAGSADRQSDDVVVDVIGAVARPGLVHLPVESRVADAVAAAGGAAGDAEVAGVNQARVVADGEQVRVPRKGEPTPPAPGPAGPGSAAGAPAAPVDLNRATPAELDSLPGVGPATAAAIITWRDEHHGFRHVEDLLEVPGIGPARLERLRPLVRV